MNKEEEEEATSAVDEANVRRDVARLLRFLLLHTDAPNDDG